MPLGLTKKNFYNYWPLQFCGTAIHFISDGKISKSETNNEIVSKN